MDNYSPIGTSLAQQPLQPLQAPQPSQAGSDTEVASLALNNIDSQPGHNWGMVLVGIAAALCGFGILAQCGCLRSCYINPLTFGQSRRDDLDTLMPHSQRGYGASDVYYGA